MIHYNPHLKRVVDIFLSFIALLILSPVFCIIIVLIKLDSPGNPFFVQERIGKGTRPFRLTKFRSMTCAQNPTERQFEPGNSCRVTGMGAFLRKTKIDELPELFNVLKGDMSIVGPRPEVPKYVQMLSDNFTPILQVRPGISDFASIKYRNEEQLLAGQQDPEDFYLNVILPNKLRLGSRYIEEISLKTDLQIIIGTLKSIINKVTPC